MLGNSESNHLGAQGTFKGGKAVRLLAASQVDAERWAWALYQCSHAAALTRAAHPTASRSPSGAAARPQVPAHRYSPRLRPPPVSSLRSTSAATRRRSHGQPTPPDPLAAWRLALGYPPHRYPPYLSPPPPLPRYPGLTPHGQPTPPGPPAARRLALRYQPTGILTASGPQRYPLRRYPVLARRELRPLD